MEGIKKKKKKLKFNDKFIKIRIQLRDITFLKVISC